jgi:hypothetical protein
VQYESSLHRDAVSGPPGTRAGHVGCAGRWVDVLGRDDRFACTNQSDPRRSAALPSAVRQ